MTADHDETTERLAEWAAGSTGTEAAVELLIESDFWLSRSEFVSGAIVRCADHDEIDWVVAASLAETVQCSRGERFLLLLACSLADPAQSVRMSELSSIDGRNLKRVQAALHTARFGW